ncbi:hypothetical protein BDY21DRAFT_82224 [Lineolata rhizophorae]|uniref:Uncharacterized protein n=1 Tax=Lineolata rhizophorae TaxID=578093 RepID=A0A6A6PBZ2_9PEZI|nr:hypothetical protein BDY21DRAFT_82224 [Lineolata rhizophorae]
MAMREAPRTPEQKLDDAVPVRSNSRGSTNRSIITNNEECLLEKIVLPDVFAGQNNREGHPISLKALSTLHHQASSTGEDLSDTGEDLSDIRALRTKIERFVRDVDEATGIADHLLPILNDNDELHKAHVDLGFLRCQMCEFRHELDEIDLPSVPRDTDTQSGLLEPVQRRRVCTP